MLAPYAEVRLYFPVNGITYRFTCIAGAYYAMRRPDLAHKLAKMAPDRLRAYVSQLKPACPYTPDERANLVQDILEAAVAQNPKTRTYLLHQDDPIEIWGDDYFWCRRPGSGRGLNMYGRVLTTVRRRLERSKT